MQQTEILELLGPILRPAAQRRRVTDYAAVLLLLIVAAWWGYSAWRNNQIPKIESIALVPNSVVIVGPAESVGDDGKMELCPGDRFTVRYQLAIEGEGVIYADDAAHRAGAHGAQTVKFSTLWRDYAKTSTRTYENPWIIPPMPDMAVDGQRAWAAGRYTRVVSVAASNIYISRYVRPAIFEVPFTIREDCP